ncbi:dihydrofolate reductase family protein [Demequina capsici]|uniref:Dihydrofolate reductase family protein n=1 Tax=Demequina capsici TaxID=3075620 RepID=A0AA96F5U7_9MICO|nr:dihydrofolate reductase family protein [Demequina sp. OYTSA14]WNM23708.1 dihydrofolate reductase family protein [Demequina sp. OYTSA14]
MGRLVYSMITSLDGFVNDPDGIGWVEPGEQAHRFINGRSRAIGTLLMGRRMYDVMKAWQTMATEPSDPEVYHEYGELWRAADKVVFSTTREEPETPRTRVERSFDATAVRALVDASSKDVSIDGPTLAAQALQAGIVDEVSMYVQPIVVGAGQRFLPARLRLDLGLEEERRFDDGMVFLRYDVRR